MAPVSTTLGTTGAADYKCERPSAPARGLPRFATRNRSVRRVAAAYALRLPPRRWLCVLGRSWCCLTRLQRSPPRSRHSPLRPTLPARPVHERLWHGASAEGILASGPSATVGKGLMVSQAARSSPHSGAGGFQMGYLSPVNTLKNVGREFPKFCVIVLAICYSVAGREPPPIVRQPHCRSAHIKRRIGTNGG